MKSVTITLDDDLVRRARIVAVAEGQSLSRFIRETVERHLDRPMIRPEAETRHYAGAPLDASDPAPVRDPTDE